MQLESTSGMGSADVGPGILAHLRTVLAVEPEWCVEDDRSFTWWPGAYGVHVCAERMRRDCGFDIVRMRVETAILTDVPSSRAAQNAVAHVNSGATMAGAVLDRGTVRACTGLYLHEETADWGSLLLAHAAVIQLACAAEIASVVRTHAGRTRAPATHPGRGQRPEPSPIVHAALSLAAASHEFGPVDAEEIDALRPHLNGVVAAALFQPSAALIEIPYTGAEPSWIDRCRSGDGDPVASAMLNDWSARSGPPPETALLVVDGLCVHPALGPGCLLLLTFPTGDAGGDAVARLARRERRAFSRCHGIGGWFSRHGHIAHVAFVPSGAMVRGLLLPLVWNAVVRVRFVKGEIEDR